MTCGSDLVTICRGGVIDPSWPICGAFCPLSSGTPDSITHPPIPAATFPPSPSLSFCPLIEPTGHCARAPVGLQAG